MAPGATESAKEITSFDAFELDDRLLRAIQKLGFKQPTLIQSKTIQLGLEGHDIVGKAKTGSGKTAAYGLPLLNKILRAKANDSVCFWEPKTANVA
jgi:superfamily II DNA/RNA helicase